MNKSTNETLTVDDVIEEAIIEDESEVILLDEEEDENDDELYIIDEEADEVEEVEEVVKTQLDAAKEEAEALETKPVVNNARLREDYAIPGEIDSVILDAAHSGMLETSNFLPNSQLDIAIKELSLALIEARKTNNDADARMYEQVINGILGTSDTTGVADYMFRDSNAGLEQGLYDPETGNLTSMRPVEVGSRGDELKGDVAILKAAKALNLGDVVNIPLPHSGFWVSIVPPSERDLIRLYNTFSRAKTSLGRQSQGHIFGNLSSKLNSDLFKFIKKSITSTNLSDVAKTDIDDKIMLNDLPILIWGMARSIYANGFPYRRMCDNAGTVNADGTFTGTCGDIQEVNMSLDKLLWIDNNRLNDTQKSIFSRSRAKAITFEDQQNYIKQAEFLNNFTMEFGTIKIEFRQPTVKDHLEEGLHWIDSLIDELDYTVTTDNLDDEEKEETLEIFIRSSILRDWSHYVKQIHIDDKVVKDREAIQGVLGKLGTDRHFTNKFRDSVVEYRNKSVMAAIGIPEYKCPKCGKENTGVHEDKVLTNVIPISPHNLFFLMFITKFQMVMTAVETD